MIKDLSYLHDSRALCPLPRARPAQNKHNLRLHHHTQPVRNAWELLRQPVQQSHYHKPGGWERAALMNDHRPLRVRYRAAWMTAWCVSRKCAGQIPLPPYTCPTNQRRRWRSLSHAHSSECSLERAPLLSLGFARQHQHPGCHVRLL